MRVVAGTQLQGPYARRPLEEWSPKYREAQGIHEGIDYANVEPILARLATKAEGEIDWELWRALHDTLSLDDAYDLAELREVSRSWHDATLANLRLRRSGYGS